MDSFEARLQFIQLLRGLPKSLAGAPDLQPGPGTPPPGPGESAPELATVPTPGLQVPGLAPGEVPEQVDEQVVGEVVEEVAEQGAPGLAIPGRPGVVTSGTLPPGPGALPRTLPPGPGALPPDPGAIASGISGISAATRNSALQFYLTEYPQHYEDFQQCLVSTTAKAPPLDRVHVLTLLAHIAAHLLATADPFPRSVALHTVLPALPHLLALALPAHDYCALANLPQALAAVAAISRALTRAALTHIPPAELARLSADPAHLPDSTHPADAWADAQASAPNYAEALQKGLALLQDRVARAQLFQSQFADTSASTTTTTTTPPAPQHSIVLQRMETDRERHKRSKEQLWVVRRDTASPLDSAEFRRLWAVSAGVSAQDRADLRELQAIAANSLHPELDPLQN